MTNAIQKSNGHHVNGLDRLVDNFFNHSMRRFFDGNLWDSDISRTTGTVPVNVRETENQYEVDVIAPGCKREDFRVQVQSSELSISLTQNEQKQEDSQNEGWVRNEFMQRSFSRHFTLDDTVNPQKISATYVDGILKIVLPKSEKAKPRTLSIDVK